MEPKSHWTKHFGQHCASSIPANGTQFSCFPVPYYLAFIFFSCHRKKLYEVFQFSINHGKNISVEFSSVIDYRYITRHWLLIFSHFYHWRLLYVQLTMLDALHFHCSRLPSLYNSHFIMWQTIVYSWRIRKRHGVAVPHSTPVPLLWTKIEVAFLSCQLYWPCNTGPAGHFSPIPPSLLLSLHVISIFLSPFFTAMCSATF